MHHLSFARIMYGTSEGIRSDSGLSSIAARWQPTLSLHSNSPARQAHGLLTLESLLHKAWQALSPKH
jgi:hypothetical protein